MSLAVLDDHLLRDLLSADISEGLRRLLRSHDPATTNLYYLRLCRSTVSGRGGVLTGAWPEGRRRALARSLVQLPEEISIPPMRSVAFRMAELLAEHRVSNLGAEAVAAAEAVGGPLCVWTGDDGPGIRACASATHVSYRTIAR